MTKCKLQNQERGLYQSQYEHDACGVGMIVNIHGNKSHELVDQALRVLENMRHRGAEVGKDGFRFPTSSFCCRAFPYPKRGNMAPVWYSCPKRRRHKARFSAS